MNFYLKKEKLNAMADNNYYRKKIHAPEKYNQYDKSNASKWLEMQEHESLSIIKLNQESVL